MPAAHTAAARHPDSRHEHYRLAVTTCDKYVLVRCMPAGAAVHCRLRACDITQK
jgi:hypothetical protein